MRKTWILVILVAVLAALYILIPDSKQSSDSIEIEDRKFMVKDHEQIDYLTIKNPGYPLMHLRKKSENNWILNDRYKADNYVVKNMLGVLSNMKIKYIPPPTMLDKILGELDQIGIAIKAYNEEGEILSDFIMGSNDSKEGASFCIQRDADQAYAMHISAAEGGLRNYFNMPIRELRDKSVFIYDTDEIRTLEMRYPKNNSNSFRIERSSGKLELQPLEQMGNQNGQINEKTVDSYIKDFSSLVAEAVRTGEIDEQSIRNRLAFAEMTISDSKGTERKYEFYPLIDILVDSINTQKVIDNRKVERFFVFDSEGEAFIVQQRLVGKLFRPLDYFMD